MDTTSWLFYIFSAILLFAGFRVITARSTVHAALFLVLAFFNAACIWMLLKAEFLAIVLVLVYVGAVMVLFLFVVMMLDINNNAVRQQFWKQFPLASAIGVVIVLQMAAILFGGFGFTPDPAMVGPMDAAVAEYGNTKLLGMVLYTEYIYPLQVAAVLLLVAIIAAIALTLRKRKDSRAMDVSEQLKARKADRVRLVKMAPNKRTDPTSAAAAAEAKAAGKGEKP